MGPLYSTENHAQNYAVLRYHNCHLNCHNAIALESYNISLICSMKHTHYRRTRVRGRAIVAKRCYEC